MDEKDSEAPIPRAAWKRLLEDSTGRPPETTDARIRAAARRVLAPGGRRWWLPVSLAASFVLAVLIAQSQLRPIRAPIVTESDSGRAGDSDARVFEREQEDATRESGQAPATPSRREAPAREEAEQSGYTDSELAADAAVAGPRVGGPERDLKAASEMPEEALARPELQGVAPAAVTAKLPAPEAWYARIEELRKQGRVDEANRELERLEKSYPGWLERHLEEHAPR